MHALFMTDACMLHTWHINYARFLNEFCLKYARMMHAWRMHDSRMTCECGQEAGTISYPSLPTAQPLGHCPSNLLSEPPLYCFGVALSGVVADGPSSARLPLLLWCPSL